ncbi:MAG: class I SAM-dependent methyltransferase [Candidatus Bathyarchaeia archaeon]
MLDKFNEVEHYFTSKPRSKIEFRLIHAYLHGRRFQFLTSTGIFSKKRIDLGTRVLIEHMILPKEGHVLDLGCGYGAIGIVAAALNPNLRVVMVDINRRAVKLAKHNININGISNAEVRHGNLYEPVRGMSFNCILSNPPISAGLATVKTMITEAPKYMKDGATFQMVVKSKICGERLRRIFEETFGDFTVLVRRSGYRVLMAEKKACQD